MPETLLDKLQKRLQITLPRARLKFQALPQVPALRLALIDPDFPQDSLTREETRAVLDNPAYWAFCWPSGQCLARAILERPEWVRGQRVVDFGCGSGVVGLACLLAGARQVYFCDLDPDARLAAAVNAEQKGGLVDDWSAMPEVDLVVATDVLYDRENQPWLERFLEKTPQVLLADCRETQIPDPYRMLWEEAGHPVPDMDICGEFRHVRVWAAGNFTI